MEQPTKEDIQKLVDSKNLAESYDQDELDKMAIKIIDWVDEDEEARRPWMERNAMWLELACQVQQNKTSPWPGAANVKYPLLTTAGMQFAARSYPALVPGPNLVQGLVIGRDDTGQKFESAQRVGRHMSYQLLYQMEDWEVDMDRLCMMIPIMGCLFKKTYRDSLKELNVSELILPGELIIDYFARSVESATRKSHVIFKTNNEIRERVADQLWLEIPNLGDPLVGDSQGNPSTQAAKDKIDGTREPKVTPATPHKFVECHCYWDLDGDGYEEPYIITVHYAKKKVVRIVARFNVEDVKFRTDENGKETLVKITPTEFFTKFEFIPNPDGSIYGLGFGLLLGGINESVNTLTNQLLDSGTLNNLQAGFLGRGIRVRSGSTRFLPGEWKPVDFVGDDIKKHIFPLPTKEPSDTLFKLLEALVTSGKELASVAEIFVGKMPGQNTPATTTMATIEQGLKVFTAIHKRLYRALGKEYQKLFKLNSIHMEDDPVYFTINEPQGPVGQTVYKSDYSPENISVKPNADPNVVSQSQKLMKVQSYGALLQLQTINPQEYTKRYLEAVEAENISVLMNVGQKPPSPEEMEMQMEQQKQQGEMQSKQAELMLKKQIAEMDMQIKQMEAAMNRQEMEFELRIKAAEAQLDQQIKMQEMMQQRQMGEQDIQANQVQHEQKIRQGEEKHQVALEQAKEKPKPKGASK